jgi:hypothetical protein
MNKSPFIWLGAGRAKKRGVARRGRHLDAAARAGLPVPEGAILLDELFRIFLHEGVVEQVGPDVIVPDPIWLLEVLYRDVRFPRLQKTADVWPILADQDQSSPAPGVVTYEVDLEDAEKLAAALSNAWSFLEEDNCRRDVSIVTHIEGKTAGRAQSSAEDVEDIVTVFSGAGEESVNLPRLGRWKRPSQEFAPFLRRVQMLLRGVRRTLGDEEVVDFNWTDDGRVCWITLFN